VANRERIIYFVNKKVGCYLTAWGVYLIPQGSPTPLSIFTRPLFWGLIVILGGFCFIFAPHIMGKVKGEK